MVTTLSLHQQTIMVSTLNVLLLTLNKALPGGRPRITMFVLMFASVWIKLNHASMLPLSILVCSGLNVWRSDYIHRRFKLSMVLWLKCLLWSNWHGVKFDWCSRVTICIDIGCIYGLTPAEISKSYWVSQWAEFKWEGKPRFWINVAQHMHVDATLIQPCLSK